MAEDFKQWDARDEDGASRYQQQSKIIKEALSQPGHDLDRLLELMRSSGESALYLCGVRLDSDYALGSGDLGTAISVLPEDGPKAATPGYHPASTESASFHPVAATACNTTGTKRPPRSLSKPTHSTSPASFAAKNTRTIRR